MPPTDPSTPTPESPGTPGSPETSGTPETPGSPGTLDLTRGVRRAAIALAVMGVVGLPITYAIARAGLGSDRLGDSPWTATSAATLAGAWVWLVAMLGLVPLWLARTAPPTQQVNARLGHVLLRLLLTAGGLVVLLLTLPESDRLTVGLFGLGWYALTWLVDFGLLRMNAAQAGS